MFVYCVCILCESNTLFVLTKGMNSTKGLIEILSPKCTFREVA